MEHTSTTKESGKVSIKKKSGIPQKDKDFLDICKIVDETWKNNRNLTLKWTTEEEFSTGIINYEKAFSIRTKVGSVRPEITKQLRETNKKINTSTSYIKSYIADKYNKSEAVSYYPQFGLVKEGKAWKIPGDHNQRSHSLDLMIEGIQKHGFGTKNYGKAFWSDTRVTFNNLLRTAVTSDQTVSSEVSNKNATKKQLSKTLNAVMGIIKHNYPDTYRAELRNWGFQKEKY